MNEPSFDLESVYDEKIAPLMTQIIDICKANDLPMYASFLYMNDPDGDDGVCTTFVMPTSRPIPEKFLHLRRALAPAPSMRMTVTGGDGHVTDTIILG